jgi:hypothetical protein
MTFKGSTKRAWFWIVLIIASCAGIIFSINYFSQALPLTHLNLTMDRQAALKQASIIAQKFHLGPQAFRQAASFETDTETQFFVELEAGGKKAFQNMLQTKLYEPYTWEVRHFQESEHNEVTIIFTPDGKPYGFKETLAETAPGAHLAKTEAQAIAEQFATHEWKIDLSSYKLIESSQETRTSGRVDHTFVYERTDHHIGIGHYRLRLVVRGKKVTELSHFVKIPDAFTLRYQEMRSANKTLAGASGILALLLYILAGGLLGLYFLSKTGSLIWRGPLIGASILSTLQFAAGINNIPRAWMTYDTALSAHNFMLMYLVQTFIAAIAFFALMTVVFATAEGLTRRAFGSHPQFWKLWSKNAVHSTAVLGRTVAGYLMVGLQLALIITIYLIANRFLHWWWPSDLIIDPNILSTRFPGLSSISNAFNAGFLEECLFRAVPLACAALLGNRFGRRGWWIAGAFVLQALVFGGAHADYPAQPAYARLIELIIPSFMFAGMYLMYGLLPVIIMHSMYDLALMSLPLFVTSAPGMLLHQLVVIIVALIPLLVILVARLRAGAFTKLDLAYYNAAWAPRTSTHKVLPEVSATPSSPAPRPVSKKIFIIVGIVGGIGWIACTRFCQDAPRLSLNRLQAIDCAQAELFKNNIVLSDTWRTLSVMLADQSQDNQHKFVWQTRSVLYKQLIGSYLVPPVWLIRFVQCKGTVTERSEEYRVFVTESGKILRFEHRLPESQHGAQLSELDARTCAEKKLHDWSGPDSQKFKLISAESDKKPNRMDWLFTFSNPMIDLKTGETRLLVRISGDTVTDAIKTVHVPEQWERDERKQYNTMQLIKIICLLLLFAVFIFVVFAAKISHYTHATTLFFSSFIILILYALFFAYNSWPSFIGQFNTSEPWSNQLFSLVMSLGAGSLIRALVLAFMFSLVFSRHVTKTLRSCWPSLQAGISLGLVGLGTLSFITFISPSTHPLWANYEGLAFRFSCIGTILAYVMVYIIITAFTLIIIKSCSKAEKQLHFKTMPLIFICLVIGCAVAGLQSFPTIVSWLVAGLFEGIVLFFVYHYVLRANYTVIVPTLTIYSVGRLIQEAAFNAYPCATIACILAALGIVLMGISILKRI